MNSKLENQQMFRLTTKIKALLPAALFACFIASTFISYRSYLFGWDDADYLFRSIAVSRALYSGNVHGLGAMATIRPPAMTLLGIPWGPLESWDAASKCFITLGAVISLLAATSLYLMLRIGIRPLILVIASMCVGAALGPYPVGTSAHGYYPPGAGAHWAATAFLADSLFAWTALAAALLIPYEAIPSYSPIRDSQIRTDVLRGIVWGSILSLGVMTKINFLYFIALVLPALLFIRYRQRGLRSTLVSLSALACSLAPSAIYLAIWGRPVFQNARASSFGPIGRLYYVPLLQFLSATLRESPGLIFSLGVTTAGLGYLFIKRRQYLMQPGFFAFVVMIGFCIITLAAPNRQIRYVFPAIVALPFLMGILVSDKRHSVTGKAAALRASLVFGSLFVASVPMQHRADRETLNRAEAVLVEAAGCNAKQVVLATDSPTLNLNLFDLAHEIVPSQSSTKVTTLAYQVMKGAPIEEDFQVLNNADEVVFQDRHALMPLITNTRVSQYEQYVLHRGYLPRRIGVDLSVYPIRCRNVQEMNASASRTMLVPINH